MWCQSHPYFFPSTLVKKISHNQLKTNLFFFTFGHSNHPNFLKKSHNSGPIPVLRKRTHMCAYMCASILTLVTLVPQSRLAFGQTPYVGWPAGLQPLFIRILQCAALLATGGYNRPCSALCLKEKFTLKVLF